MLEDKRREQLLACCAEISDDDGIDPKHDSRPSQRNDSNHRKARQLCRQVEVTLSQVLSGETGDEALRGLVVESVQPAPGTRRLLVSVRPTFPVDADNRADLEYRLRLHTGSLRAAVAAAIHRKRTPALAFSILAAQCPAEREEAS